MSTSYEAVDNSCFQDSWRGGLNTDSFSVWGHGYLCYCVMRKVLEHGILCYCVMRRVLEHGLHGLHGLFLWGLKTGGFGPIVRKHKIIREIRVIRVQ